MIKIGQARELGLLKKYPVEVAEEVQFNINIHGREYGEYINIFEDLGGYVVVIDDESELQEVNLMIGSDITQNAIPEFVAVLRCETKEVFTLSLFLCGNEFGIITVIPYKITPENLLQYAAFRL